MTSTAGEIPVSKFNSFTLIVMVIKPSFVGFGFAIAEKIKGFILSIWTLTLFTISVFPATSVE